MNIMQALCAICFMLAFLLLISRFLPRRRKQILILMELIAAFLLWFDILSYVYNGDTSAIGFVMIRISNFGVFFLTSAIVLGFNLYLIDLLSEDKGVSELPKRLTIVNYGSALGMVLVVVSQFSGLYYSFDENNVYHRGPGFLICYIVPVIFPIIQYTVIRQYKHVFRKLIYISLVSYIFVPIIMGILQIFTYGISIVNIAMVFVSISLYVFAYMDLNYELEKMHQGQLDRLRKDREVMKRLFDQTAKAFVAAVEKRDRYARGSSLRSADYARMIAFGLGKDEVECDEVYYSALLHDVGNIAIPDSILEKSEELTDEEREIVKNKPLVSAEILSSIVDYPYLKEGALYYKENYDGSGYPKGLKGSDIPEVARIVAVSDAYVSMTSKKSYRDALPYQIVREDFVKSAGAQFDPELSDIMVRIMDQENASSSNEVSNEVERELECREYRQAVTTGIPVTEEVMRIKFLWREHKSMEEDFSAPSILLFDSYDRHVHRDKRTIDAYRYVEYGELWFDGHNVCTRAKNMEVDVSEYDNISENEASVEDGWIEYEITAGRFEDHVSIVMSSPGRKVEAIVALLSKSKASYLGITGENCQIKDITFEMTGEKKRLGDIRRISDEVSYIDRLESDLPNIQIDRNRSAATPGIELKNHLVIDFHTLTLPSASLVWHCPYFVIFYSDDKRVRGRGYKEYALIKINGEKEGLDEFAKNHFEMKRDDTFPGWNEWNRKNKDGLECRVTFVRKGNEVITRTQNLGVLIENTTEIKEKHDEVYVALTGDQVALTDIRIR